jgi:hypothetical protein
MLANVGSGKTNNDYDDLDFRAMSRRGTRDSPITECHKRFPRNKCREVVEAKKRRLSRQDNRLEKEHFSTKCRSRKVPPLCGGEIETYIISNMRRDSLLIRLIHAWSNVIGGRAKSSRRDQTCVVRGEATRARCRGSRGPCVSLRPASPTQRPSRRAP